MTDSSRMTTKGQITIPHAIRSQMGLRRGDRVLFDICEHGLLLRKAVLSPVADLERLVRELTERLRRRGLTAEEVVEAVRWSRSTCS